MVTPENISYYQEKQFEEAIALSDPTAYPEYRYTFLDSGIEYYDKELFGFPGGIISEIVAATQQLNNSAHILIPGCGSGRMARDLYFQFTHEYPELPPPSITELTARDIRSQGQKNLDTQFNISHQLTNLNTLSLPPNSFHLIYSRLTARHLTHPLDFIARLYAGLTPNGRCHVDFGFSHLIGRTNGANMDERYAKAEMLENNLKQLNSGLEMDGLRLTLTKTSPEFILPPDIIDSAVDHYCLMYTYPNTNQRMM